MMESAIGIKNFSKNYGDVKAVIGISFNVGQGEMFGLVGPDGAGKTTTIRTLCGLIEPNEGSIEVLGFDLKKNKKEIQNQVGYLSQKFSLYGDLTVDENIEFFADIHSVKNYQGRRNELLEFTRLTPFRKRLADNLSGGMKQKLALACSLIHKPKILFLDEPTTGVDPVSRRDFWKILSNLINEGITIFMSTPYLDEAERCNRVALMDQGKIISLDKPEIIKNSIDMEVLEIACDRTREAFHLLKDNFNYEVQLFGDKVDLILPDYKTAYPKIEKLLDDNSINIFNHRIITPTLENVFIHLVKKAS
jgi:drug efflux transport system ATP-binding protein